MAQYRVSSQELVGNRSNPTLVTLDIMVVSDTDTELNGNGGVIINSSGTYEFSFSVSDIQVSGVDNQLATGLLQVTPSGGSASIINWTRGHTPLIQALDMTSVNNGGELEFNAGDIVHLVNYVEPLQAGNAVLTVKPECNLHIHKL